MAVAESTSVTGRRVADDTPFLDLEPGDYCRRTVPGTRRLRWWVCCPDDALAPLPEGFYKVEEHDDGTISVLPRPALPNVIVSPRGWRGHLDRGVWREAGGA